MAPTTGRWRRRVEVGADARALALNRIEGQIDHLEFRARALSGLFQRPVPGDAAEILAEAVEADRLVFFSVRNLN